VFGGTEVTALVATAHQGMGIRFGAHGPTGPGVSAGTAQTLALTGSEVPDGDCNWQEPTVWFTEVTPVARLAEAGKGEPTVGVTEAIPGNVARQAGAGKVE